MVTLTGFAIVVILIHVLSLVGADVSPSRKRIRIANAMLMMLGVASLANALGVASPDRPREFTLAWTFVMCSMAMVIGVACLDALNTVRLHSCERRAVRRELDTARLEVMVLTQGLANGGPAKGNNTKASPSSPPQANTPP